MPNGSAWLDPLHSPVLQEELPGLPTALAGETMREYLQIALFGKSHTQYRIERCAPGKAIYTGDTCALRYELVVKETSSGKTFQPLVVGRMFQDQLACALYMRDKLLPLATLMRGRAEIAPFIAPVAMIEPLNMVVYAFPIDGELPTLVGATDRQRMTEILAETLPEVLAGQLTIQDLGMVPVNYARRYRCVMRYEIECLAPGNKLQRREVYGKIATDTQGTLIAPVIAALRERVLGNRNAYQFNIPRSLGFRPDLQLSLLEAIPGTPQINQLLKARLSGADLPAGELTLDRALDSCAQIANALDVSPDPADPTKAICNSVLDGSDPSCVPKVCQPGATQPCYTGKSGTSGVGQCHGGKQTCNSQGQWDPTCVGEVTPPTSSRAWARSMPVTCRRWANA
jgi:hypothetical protein